jgi:hypothetical protein
MPNPVNSSSTPDARIVENSAGQAILPTQSSIQTSIPLDNSWVKVAFMTPSSGYTNYDSVSRFFSTASMKFTSSVIGGSIEINPKPQFTRYADIRSKGILPNRNDVTPTNVSGNYGMGRYYSEAFDDNAQRIYMRFGVPQYNSITSFLLNAADYSETQLARTGRISFLYQGTKAIGTIAMFYAFPVLTAGIYLYKGVSALLGSPTSKYYTLKPTMHAYWAGVNTLVNAIAVAKGIYPFSFTNPTDGAVNTPGKLFNLDNGMVDSNGNIVKNTTLDQLHKLMPNIISSSGYIDVFAIAARPQALANKLMDQVHTAALNSNTINVTDSMKNNPDDPAFIEASLAKTQAIVGNGNLVSFIQNSIYKLESYFKLSSDPAKNTGIEVDPRAASVVDNTDGSSGKASTVTTENGPTQSTTNGPDATSFGSFLEAEFQGGAQFAIFQVDYTGPVSESFSNSTVESELSNKINSTSSSAREARFSLEDGNVAGGLLTSVVGAVGDVAAGALDAVSFGYGTKVLSALGVLAGQGFIDIPKHWQSSSASLPRSTYSIDLVSPYGNQISQLLNLYIPLAMLLVGALPLATGPQSYTSPFIVQLFDRGRSQIQLGMIESLSITRGTSNLGFTNLGSPLAMKVSFNVVDLSTILSMPLTSGAIFSKTEYSRDMIINDYIAVLAGQDIYSQIYGLPRLKMSLARAVDNFKKYTSPAFWASTMHNTVTAGALSFPPVGTIARAGEGLSRGSSLLNPMNN